MRILGQNPADNSISIRLETDDDSWHLYNVVEVGDLVTASTTRREEKSADKINNERMEKKRMTLGVRVEKIEFSEDDMRIKLLGTIEKGPQDIGQHHTLMIEVGDNLSISKKRWKEAQTERLQRAVADTLTMKFVRAALREKSSVLALAGGVSANNVLRTRLQTECDRNGIRFCRPDMRFCTDNAAMIACQGYYMLRSGEVSGLDLNPSADEFLSEGR